MKPPALSPSNVEAEAALLGALMTDNRWIDPIAEIVTAADFADALHGRIFESILQLAATGATVNAVTLRPSLEHDPALKALAAPGTHPCAYLVQLSGNVAVLVGVKDFALQIAELSRRRRLIAGMQRAIDAAGDMSADNSLEGIIATADEAFHAATARQSRSTAISIQGAWDLTFRELEDEASGATSPGIRCEGFPDFDRLTGTMRRGSLNVLAGRPGMGKTAVGVEVCVSTARGGTGALFASLEMPRKELTERIIASSMFQPGESVTYEDVRRAAFSKSDRQRLVAVRREIASWPLELIDTPELQIARLPALIRRSARKMAANGQDLGLVVIDYLGLIKGGARGARRYEEVSEISRRVKAAARECNVAIVLLAQLNRAVENRDDKRPQLADLRDSGDIEQDADAVVFVYRPSYYLERSEPPAGDKRWEQWRTDLQAARNRLQLICAKNRNGPIGSRECWFFQEHQAVRPGDFYQREIAA